MLEVGKTVYIKKMGIKRAWSFSSFELLISTLAQVGKLTRAIIFPKSFSQQKQAVFYRCLGLVKKQNVKKGSNGEECLSCTSYIFFLCSNLVEEDCNEQGTKS